MKFTNITRAGLYFTSCHREVAPGESFLVPWLAARGDRAIRAAMRDRAIAWEPSKGEPSIPGSPPAPTDAERKAEAEKRKAEAEERRRADSEALRARRDADNRKVGEQMARMGQFKVPGPIPLRAPERAGVRERPVTRADIISDGKPESLAEVMRHNKAVRMVHAEEARALAERKQREQREQHEQQAKTQKPNQ